MFDREQCQADAHARQVVAQEGSFHRNGIDQTATGFPHRSADGCLPCRSGLDAGVIGPLIRANLVRWDDDPTEAAKRRRPPGTTFALTSLGAQSLAEHEARQGPTD